MKFLYVVILMAVSSLVVAETQESSDAKLFKCMEKATFTINSECLSKQIESNVEFQQVQETVIETASNTSDRAIATMTFHPKTMSIEIVAHRDAYLAKITK